MADDDNTAEIMRVERILLGEFCRYEVMLSKKCKIEIKSLLTVPISSLMVYLLPPLVTLFNDDYNNFV